MADLLGRLEVEVLGNAREILRDLRRHLDREALASRDAHKTRAACAHQPLAACTRTPLVELRHALLLELLEDALRAALKAHEALDGAKAAGGERNA
ncbi:MAG: hypothetical protein ACK559_39085, partial [bacterium]